MKFNKKYDLDKFGPCNSVDYDKLKKIIYILESDALLDDATVQSFKKKLCRCCTVGKRANSNFRKLFHNKAMTKSKDQTDSGRYNTTCITCFKEHLLPILSQGSDPTIIAHREFNQFFYGEVCRISLFLEANLQELEAQIDFLELYIIRLDSRSLFSTRNAKKSSEDMPLLHEDYTTSPLKPKLRMRLKNKPTMSEDFNFVGNSKAHSAPKVTLKQNDKKIRELSIKRNLKMWFKKAKDLERYRTLNVATLIKILKKFDKVFSGKDPSFKSIHSEHLDCIGAFLIGDESRLKALEEAVTTFYAECFCFGNKQEARGNLLIVKGESNPRHLLLLGLKVGVLAMEIIYFLSLCLAYPATLQKFAVLPSRFFFSTIGFLIFFKFLWGFNVACWDRFSINYPVLLVINEKLLPDCEQIFSEALTLAIVFLTNLILYFFSIITSSNTLGILPSYAFVVMLLVGQLAYVAHSLFTNTSYSIMWNTHFFRILLLPFIYTIQFRDVYIMDWLLSFTKVLSNFTYGCCHLLSGHIVPWQGETTDLSSCYTYNIVYVVACLNILPIVTRQLQCLRIIYDHSDSSPAGLKRFIHPVQSLNFCRYSSSLLVVFVGALNLSKDNQSAMSYQLTITLILMSALANSAWDALVDYDQCYAPFPGQKYPFLKNRLMYRSPYLYYFVLVLNPILRLLWTLSLLPQHHGASLTVLGMLSDSLVIQLSPAIELFRRALWGLLRMETEHLKVATMLLRDTVVPIVSMKSFMMDSFAPIHFDVHRISSSDNNKKERIIAVSLHILLLIVVIIVAWTFAAVAVYR